MDIELAKAVLGRWNEGLPVFEGTLYKAASALGADPDLALTEARFYTHLDGFLLEKRAMSIAEKVYFSTAAGLNPLVLVKTASAHQLSAEELILEALRERDFVPDLEKLAFMGMQGGPAEQDTPDAAGNNPAAASQGAPGAPQQAQPTMNAPEPQPGAQVQQQPSARDAMQISPTAPEQVAGSPGGNLDQLLQSASQADAAPMGGDGLPPSGVGAGETPPPPTAEDKLQQAFGGTLDPDTLGRYAPKLEEFEQQMGMSIQDPKQIEKFVKELQKADKKVIDEGIKQMGQEQMAAQGMGGAASGGAQLDPTAPVPKKPGAGAAPGGPAPKPPGGPAAAGSPKPSDQAEAMAKVASAARAMAHAASKI